MSRKILLVEDQALIAMAETQMLKKYGYEVVTAHNGEKAIQTVDSDPDIALILMDIDLGKGMDGTEAAREILNKKDIPVVFLSSHTEPDVVEKTEKITSYGYVVKDSGETVLNASIKMAFKLFDAKREHKEKEQDLRISEHKYRMLFENMNVSFCLHEAIYDDNGNPVDYRYLDMNPLFLNNLGCTAAAIRGHTAKELFRDTEQYWIDIFGKVAKTGESVAFQNYSRELNQWFNTFVFSPQKDKFAAFFIDITAQKRAEEALQEKNTLLERIFTSSVDLISLSDLEGNFTLVGKAHEILGYDHEDLLGKNIMAFVHPDDVDTVTRIFKDFMQSGEQKSVQYRYKRINGEYLWFETIGTILRDKKGYPEQILFNTRNITEHKQHVEMLEKTRCLLSESQRIGKVGSWEINIDTLEHKWTEETFRIHEVDLDYENTVEKGIDFYTPDSKPIIEKAVKRAIELHEPFDLELKIVTAKGNLRHVHTIGKIDLASRKVFGFFQDITDRKQAEEELRRFKTISDNAVYGKAIADLQGKLLYTNRFFANIHGYDPEDLIGEHLSVFHNEHQLEAAGRTVNAIIQEGHFNPTTVWHCRKDGTEFPMLMSGILLKDENGNPQCIAASAIDITWQKQTEKKLAESIQVLSRAQKMANIGNWYLDLTTNHLSWSDEVYRIFGCEPQAFAATYEAFLDFIHPDDRAAVDEAYTRSLRDGSNGYEIEHRIVQRGSNTVRSVYERCDHERDGAGNIITSTGMVQDITENKRYAQELTQEKEYLEKILETSSDGFWVVSPDKKITSVNAAYCRMSGYSADDLTEMEIKDLDAIEDPQETAERIKRIMEHGSETFQTKHRRKDGIVFDVEISASRMDRKDGLWLICFCRDITQRAKMLQALEESQTRYQMLVSRSPDIIYLFGTKSGGIFWSEATQRILGYEPETIVRNLSLWRQSIHSDDQPLVEAATAGAIDRDSFDIEYRIKSKNGNWVWLRDRLIARIEKDGEVIIQGHAEDITELKRSKGALNDERLRLSAIIEGTDVGTWEWNFQTGETRFNEKWASIIGYTLDQISPVSIETWQQFTHAEDLKRSEQLLRAHFDGHTKMYEMEARMRHKNGHWVWVLDRGKVSTWTDDGKPEWVFGTHQEITRRKELEERHIALANAAAELQTYSAETINYKDIAETARRLSGAAFAALNLFSTHRKTFTTQVIAGLPEYIRKADKLLGHPIVGRTWDYDPDKENALGAKQTTVFPSLGALASRNFSAAIANRIAAAFHVGEVVVVQITTSEDTKGDFTLLLSEGTHLQSKHFVETYASMVGITLKRILTEQANTKLVADKETLLREVHHRIKNNMNTMTSLLSLQADTVEDAGAISAIKDAESRMRSMQMLYEQLNVSDSHNQMSLVEYLKKLVPQVVDLFPASKDVAVRIRSNTDNCEADCCTMGTKRLSTVGLIVNELITNTMKYAFPGTGRPVIHVATDCRGEEITITVEDNGVGLPESFDQEKSPGFGLVMINAMTSQLDGTLKYESVDAKGSRGTRVVLRFPSEEPR